VHEQRYNEIAARGRRRRQRDHRLMALRLTAAALSLALLAELAGALLWSPRFRVRQVELRGLRMLDSRVIMSRVALRPGARLGAISTSAIRRRLEEIPAVESARVARDWPARLVIVIRERIPAAFIRCGAGIIFLDRRGTGFTAVGAHTDGLPELKGIVVNVGRLGQPQPTEALKQAMEALAAAQEAEMTVRQVIAPAPNDLELRLIDGTSLRLGRPERLRLKVSQAKVALMQLQPLHQVEYVDVSCPDAAVWKPRLEASRSG
jgi:cell division protein FtsQ